MIRNELSSEHIDPCMLNGLADGELHVGEEERIRRQIECCRLCALYIVSGKELEPAGAGASLQLAPRVVGAANANPVRKVNLINIDGRPAHRAAVRQLRPTLRQALLLCDAEELSYGEIAVNLDIPGSIVTSRIPDARDALANFS